LSEVNEGTTFEKSKVGRVTLTIKCEKALIPSRGTTFNLMRKKPIPVVMNTRMRGYREGAEVEGQRSGGRFAKTA